MATPNQIVQEVLAGKWGNGDDRKERLNAAGYSWIEIQSLINKQYGVSHVPASDAEIAQEVIDNKWGMGVERRTRITNAGFNYNSIQSLVNRLASQAAQKKKENNTIVIPSADGSTSYGNGEAAPTPATPSSPSTAPDISTNFNNYKGKISNCGKDENGGIRGGRAGDQSGKEWWIINWYSQGWQCILRHPNKKVREYIAELGIQAAQNDKVGYDQSENQTYWNQLRSVGYWPKNVIVPCEADCSAGVIANVKAVGFLLGIPALQSINATYTGNMRAGFRAAGFEVLTGAKYLNGPDYLLPGDIILNDSQHTATNLGYGKYAENTNSDVTPSPTPAPSGGTEHRVLASVLNVRSGAGMSYGVIGQLRYGTTVTLQRVIEASDGTTWYSISSNGLNGYVAAQYIS